MQLGCELGVFASEIPPSWGFAQVLPTVCERQEQKWVMGLGTNQKGQTGTGAKFCQILSAGQTDESEEPEHKPDHDAGTRDALQPPNPMRGWR